jgi:hypothetical protein
MRPGQLEPNEFEVALLKQFAVQDPSLCLGSLHVLSRGIAFRIRPTMPFPQPGPSTTLVISVDPARSNSNEANEILRDLFGDNLPNYDSSFFRGHR